MTVVEKSGFTVFGKYDTSGRGCLDIDQFASLVQNLSLRDRSFSPLRDRDFLYIKEVCVPIFAYLNKRCNMCISFSEFMQWWSSDRSNMFFSRRADNIRTLHSIFVRYASSHRMSRKDFVAFIKAHPSLEHRSDFDIADENLDGFLCFSEFCDWLNV